MGHRRGARKACRGDRRRDRRRFHRVYGLPQRPPRPVTLIDPRPSRPGHLLWQCRGARRMFHGTRHCTGADRQGAAHADEPGFSAVSALVLSAQARPLADALLSHANDSVRRASPGASPPIVTTSLEQHHASATARPPLRSYSDSDLLLRLCRPRGFRGRFLTWRIREEAGFRPVVREGAQLREYGRRWGAISAAW